MTTKPPITLTDEAVAYIQSQMATDAAATGFRLSLTKKGCGDGKYSAVLAAAPQPSDLVVDHKGVRLYIDIGAQLQLFGMEIDYKNTPFESGLVFNNPNEKGRCGCGESPIF
jgi:iron-sulfur cluster assembly protein